MNIIIAQIFGLVALVALFASYQKENKKEFLYMQIFSNTLYMIQYFILGAFSASLANAVGAVRGMFFYKEENKHKSSILILFIFEIFFIIAGIITYDGLLTIIPTCLACIYTYGVWQKNLKITYAIGILVAVVWIYFNYEVGAYVSILASVIEFLASSIGLRRLIKKSVI